MSWVFLGRPLRTATMPNAPLVHPADTFAPRPSNVLQPITAFARGDVDAAVSALDLEPHDDVQATAKVKKHLAGVLLRRVASQMLETRP